MVPFNSGNFTNPTAIDNSFYPLVPGTQYVLDGFSNLGGGILPHRIEFTVTDLVKVVDGVTTRVVWDIDTNAGVVAESELAFQAQDNSGNVWVLGEYPEEYLNGSFSGAPSTWIGGLNGGIGGILVPGNPQVGTPPFLEGRSDQIQFFDCGQVTTTGMSDCFLGNCYNNVLVVNEWDPTDPASGTQQKYYAPGVGNYKIGAINDPQGETMQLTAVNHLDSSQMATVDADALNIDNHGYTVSRVYAQTSRAQLPQVTQPPAIKLFLPVCLNTIN